MKNKTKIGLTLLAAVVIGFLGWGVYKYGFVVTVNGQMVDRISYYQQLDKQYGKPVMEKIIQDTLIRQEAMKKNITVTNQEIDDEIKKIEERLKQSGMNLEDAMKLQGVTREVLSEQVRMQKTVEKLSAGEIKVEAKEIDTFLTENKSSLPKDKSKDDLRKMAEDELKSQKASEAAREWYNKLRQEAKIVYR